MAYFNNQMAELIRDCSKSRPTTFSEHIYPITLEIDNKIKEKNISLRNKIRVKLQKKQKYTKRDESIKEQQFRVKKEPLVFDKGPINYLEAYLPTNIPKEEQTTYLQPQLNRLDEKDEETTFHIYQLLMKRKAIFKVDEVKRKLRSKETKRMNYTQCQCCGHFGFKHKCQHIICNRQCQHFLKKKQEQPCANESRALIQEEGSQLLGIAQQVIDAKDIPGQEIKTVKITVKEEQMKIPEIDVIDDDNVKKQEIEERNDPNELEGVIETERISEVESKSQISESKKNRSGHKDLEKKGEKEEMREEQKDIGGPIEGENYKDQFFDDC